MPRSPYVDERSIPTSREAPLIHSPGFGTMLGAVGSRSTKQRRHPGATNQSVSQALTYGTASTESEGVECTMVLRSRLEPSQDRQFHYFRWHPRHSPLSMTGVI